MSVSDPPPQIWQVLRFSGVVTPSQVVDRVTAAAATALKGFDPC